MSDSKVLVLAGSGFLSDCTSAYIREHGWEVRLLTRDKSRSGTGIYHWDGRTDGDWWQALEGADVLINFCGRSVNCRYNERNRREILESRVNATQALGRALQATPNSPKLWLNSASATYYRASEDRDMDEATGEPGEGFSVNVCRAWEAAMSGASLPGVRQIILRTTMVLGYGRNSVYPVLMNLVRSGLGGRQGNGYQFVSWIHHHDFVRAVEFLIDSDLSGPVNLAAPYPITNRYFMQALRRSLGKRFGLPALAWMIEVGAVFMRTESELVLKSRRVVPGRLLESGFTFLYPTIDQAFRELAEKKG